MRRSLLDLESFTGLEKSKTDVDAGVHEHCVLARALSISLRRFGFDTDDLFLRLRVDVGKILGSTSSQLFDLRIMMLLSCLDLSNDLPSVLRRNSSTVAWRSETVACLSLSPFSRTLRARHSPVVALGSAFPQFEG